MERGSVIVGIHITLFILICTSTECVNMERDFAWGTRVEAEAETARSLTTVVGSPDPSGPRQLTILEDSCTSAATTCTSSSEVEALITFHKTLQDPAEMLSDWNPNDTSPCLWTRILYSSSSGHVVSINLRGMYLKGSISSSIGSLHNLGELDLSHNYLIGRISESLTNTSLWTLDLSLNYLIGRIPESLTNTSLWSLDLSHNYLTGRIPECWSNTNTSLRLVDLDLSYNFLLGDIPESLFMTNPDLNMLYLSHNNLTNRIPESLTNTSLWTLDLSLNYLIGRIPESLTNTSLWTLDLSLNYLTGRIPECWSNTNTRLGLVDLDLYYNFLLGHIPEDFAHLYFLQRLKLGANYFTGPLPSLSKWPLKTLGLEDNQVGGNIPEYLGDCSRLEVFALHGNLFNGSLPSSLGRLVGSLRVLMVGSNNLTGAFPQWITNLTSLQVLDLSINAFYGSLPDNFSLMDGLKEIKQSTSYSNIYEEIEVSAKGSQLSVEYIVRDRTSFDVSGNHLIPENIGNLKGMRYLTLADNSFDGLVPISLSNLLELESPDLSGNRLSGHLPFTLKNLTSLSYFNVSFNNLTGRILDSPQLQTQKKESFSGNPGLCGLLLDPCEDPESPATPTLSPALKRRDGSRRTVLAGANE